MEWSVAERREETSVRETPFPEEHAKGEGKVQGRDSVTGRRRVKRRKILCDVGRFWLVIRRRALLSGHVAGDWLRMMSESGGTAEATRSGSWKGIPESSARKMNAGIQVVMRFSVMVFGTKATWAGVQRLSEKGGCPSPDHCSVFLLPSKGSALFFRMVCTLSRCGGAAIVLLLTRNLSY